MNPQTLLEQLAIQQLLSRYAMAVDERDAAALAACLAADATIVSPTSAITQDVANTVVQFLSTHFERTMHCVHNHHYTIDGDRASGVAYCVASHIRARAENRNKVDWHIRYHDELVKHNGQWLFRSRRLEILFETKTPVTVPS